MRRVVAAVAVALACMAGRAADGGRHAGLVLTPTKAKLGDAIAARLTVTLAPGDAIEPSGVPLTWGKAEVLSGGWEPAAPTATTRTWAGTIAVYEIGTIEVPPVEIAVRAGGSTVSVATDPATLTIEGVLPAQAKPEEKAALADLKPPATIPPDYTTLRRAAAALVGLLAAALISWWLWRRYASRLAAVKAPEDPFRKLPPHVWVYEELEKLLARRLAEEGNVGLFYDELTRIVKRYLEGRYRVDLLDRTTSEVPRALQQSGAPKEAGTIVRGILETADAVKFARESMPAEACRRSVDEAYRLVDLTKPQAATPAVEGAA